jgi:hypothetical protein
MTSRWAVLTRIAYICLASVGFLMGFLAYLGPSPVLDREHALWWTWVIGFSTLLVVGVPFSFITHRQWPNYAVAVGAMLLLIWQVRGAIAILDVRPPFHSSPWTVVILVGVLLLEVSGLLSALTRVFGR